MTTYSNSCNDDLLKPVTDSNPIKIVIVTGGHDFDKENFFQMFDDFENIDYVESFQEDDSEIFESASNLDPYDVIVLYNMSQKITKKRQKNFVDILNKGKGLVALHHCNSAFNGWDEYEKIVGVKFFYNEERRNGKTYQESTFKHDVDMNINVSQKQHAITLGIKDFEINDETYKGCYFEDDNNILLTTSESNNDKPIAWTREYGKSRVCYIQLGHGPEAYENENYRQLVYRAVKWSIQRN